MLKPLDFDFPLMSDLSRRPPHAVPRSEWLAEIDEELAQRRLVYPRLVAKSAMKEAEAARHIAIMLAIRDDLARFDPGAAPSSSGSPSKYHFDGMISWDAKVREIRRELQLRRNIWPKKIAKPADPMTEAAARRRIERLEAIHFAYWIKLEYYDGEAEGLGATALIAATRERASHVRAWEIEQHAAGNPAARGYLSPEEIIALGKGRKAA